MQASPLGPRLLRLGVLALFLGASACGGSSGSAEATPDDVDLSTDIAVTEAEYAAFRAPSDGVITEAQVEAYLKTSLLQFDLVRKHSEGLHERYAEMEKRAEKGGTIAGLRNLVDAGRTLTQAGDLIGGSYVRSARSLGYNPAELEWVQERMGAVAMYLAMKPMHEAAQRSAREMREQAERLRSELRESEAGAGFTDEELDSMVSAADEIEANSHGMEVEPGVLASVEVLARARPAVTDPMWTTIGFTGAATGLLALTGLGDSNDEEAQQKLDEYRRLFTDALANRTTLGMERSGTDDS